MKEIVLYLTELKISFCLETERGSEICDFNIHGLNAELCIVKNKMFFTYENFTQKFTKDEKGCKDFQSEVSRIIKERTF